MPAEYLLFIDTNKLLDFYRWHGDATQKTLKHIDDNRNKIITTHQVEMEFLKNRQKVILADLAKLPKQEIKEVFPAYLSGIPATASLKEITRKSAELIETIRQSAQELLASPEKSDPVYQSMQRLFANATPLNLRATSKQWPTIQRQARERFELGHPPRKAGDTTFGDAISWEWIIQCALNTGRSVLIVSRDHDFGVEGAQESYLNDWLRLEFGSRVKNGAEILLTAKLTEAFKLMNVKVTPAEEQEETEVQKRVETKSPPFVFSGINWNSYQSRHGDIGVVALQPPYNFDFASYPVQYTIDMPQRKVLLGSGGAPLNEELSFPEKPKPNE